jgi:DNA-binding CsgD family transcriptional regulator
MSPATEGEGDGGSALLERESELAVVTASLEAVSKGDGSLIVLAGAAGIGKSALVAAATTRARALGLVVRSGRGSEIEQEFSFGVIRQLFEPVIRSVPADQRERILSGAAAASARLFADAPVDPTDGGDGGFATLHGIYWLVSGIAMDRPLVLAVDDVHWADGPSLRALNYLASRIADLPVVLIVTVRPHEPTVAAELVAELESHPTGRRLELSALGPAGVAAMVRSADAAADAALCRAFYESSAGNPLYVRELIRSVDWRQGIPGADAVRQAAVASVADRVTRRVASLGPHAPRLAAGMAVLGTRGLLRDAQRVADLQEQDAAEIARAMCRAEILESDDPFEWVHPVVRRSIYDSLPVTERDSLHARAAEVLAQSGAPPSAVASHFSALRPAGSARVVAGLLCAADEALARDAADVAVGLLRRALQEGAQEPSRAALLLRLGQIEVTRRDPVAEQVLLEARSLSDDPRHKALAVLGIMESYVFQGRWDAAAELSERALVDLEDLESDLVLELELARALVCMFDPALMHLFQEQRSRLRELARGYSWPARALSAALAMMNGFRGQDLGEVRGLCEHALAGGALISERGAGAYASGHVVGALIAVEAFDAAHDFIGQLEAAAQSHGSIANMLVARGNLGRIASIQGNLVEGEEILRPLLDTTLQNAMTLNLVIFLWWMTDIIIERPSQRELGGLVESLELPPVFANAAGGAWVLLVRGRLRAVRGERERAEADLRTATSIFDGLGYGPTHAPFRSALALVLRPEDGDEARKLVAEELEAAAPSGLSGPIGIALRAQGILSGGDDGIEQLRESVAVLSASPLRYEHARSLVELGSLLRRTGRRSDSREPLAAGLELAHACGAERLSARARDELVASGARPRNVVHTGFAALTASERRIVRLAAQRRTNPEIAQELYVSVKTVETHLSSAYRTLGLRGQGARHRLPELIAEADQVTSS